MTVSDAELWEARARAAEDAAGQVDQLRQDLDRVLSRYCLGEGCVEGEELHAALQSLFDATGQVLADSVDDARHLAATCRTAARALADADEANAEGIADGAPG